jgi:hypothetical protein
VSTSLKRQHYLLALVDGDDTTEHTIDVGPGDQLRAELEGKKRKLIPGPLNEHGLAFTTLCVYFGAVRAGVYAGDVKTFLEADLYEYEAIKDDDGEPQETPVVPTPPEGQSPSGSPSQPASQEPSTGSTPTSTTA